MRLNREFLISIIILFFSISLTIFYRLEYKKNTAQIVPNPSFASQSKTPFISLSLTKVKKHRQPNDCWVIINHNVYNLTSYLKFHPGGAGVIIPFCGQDASQAFLTKGGKGSHSPSASQQLQQLYLGPLNAKITIETVNKANNLNISSFPSYEDD